MSYNDENIYLFDSYSRYVIIYQWKVESVCFLLWLVIISGLFPQALEQAYILQFVYSSEAEYIKTYKGHRNNATGMRSIN